MNRKNCNDKSHTNSSIYPSYGTEAQTTRISIILKKVQLILAVVTVITITLAVTIFVVFIGKNNNTVQKESANAPQNIFYLKGSSLFYSPLNAIQPQKITNKFYRDPIRSVTVPIFMSDNGKWLFYPQGNGKTTDMYHNADLYGSQLGTGQTNPELIAQDADIFTTNQDASKLIYLVDHKLYWGTKSNFHIIAENVDRYFTNKDSNKIVYLSSDKTLYYMDANMKSKKLADRVNFKYVSQDLNIIYYTDLKTLYLIKDCENIVKIYNGNPSILHIYKNGDLYYQNGTNLYFYSKGESTLISNTCSYLYSCNDGLVSYPYTYFYCGTAEPMMMYKDSSKNFFIYKGAKVLKKISGGNLADAKFDPKGTNLYYIATYNETDSKGDLFYVTIEGNKVSNSTKITTGVTIYNSHYAEDHFMYMKNENDNTGEMYIDDKMIDRGVYLNFSWNEVTKIQNDIFYPINTKNYHNDITNTDYTDDTIMLYRNGTTKKIADNVIDYMVFEDKFVYLTIKNPDADYGTLHLYDPDGEDKVIDTKVTAIIRPKTDRDRGGEIDIKSVIYQPEYE
jgi:hypothetical protein